MFYRYSDQEYRDDMAAEQAEREEQEALAEALLTPLPVARGALREVGLKTNHQVHAERTGGVFVEARKRVNDAIARTLRRTP